MKYKKVLQRALTFEESNFYLCLENNPREGGSHSKKLNAGKGKLYGKNLLIEQVSSHK